MQLKTLAWALFAASLPATLAFRCESGGTHSAGYDSLGYITKLDFAKYTQRFVGAIATVIQMIKRVRPVTIKLL